MQCSGFAYNNMLILTQGTEAKIITFKNLAVSSVKHSTVRPKKGPNSYKDCVYQTRSNIPLPSHSP